MQKSKLLTDGVPLSVSMGPTLENAGIDRRKTDDKKRIIFISAWAVLIAAASAIIAKALVYLIDLCTNIAFYGEFSFSDTNPWSNSLGLFVILIPAIGGLIVGLIARVGSPAIRGHGIPEAMEQVLTNESRVKPALTFLKPLSAAISIGTGGPFGAEGPIIASGGALGSTIGQVLEISPAERKVLLASGATAGMAAIFGTPVAAIFLAVELLLFEFSPRTIIPVMLACITGTAGHLLLFGTDPVFKMPALQDTLSTEALFAYSVIGVITGAVAVLVTKGLYALEDLFERLPVHWMWWPAIGGVAVGVIGYFAPRTMGVGYDNITAILNGALAVKVIVALCALKLLSWMIALSSGTSGGTLAPLLTIGGGIGAILGHAVTAYFPSAGIDPPVAALIGMSAMFAGASRAFVTSVLFALETTQQRHVLLPLLAGCGGAYLLSFLFMRNTIMTEKIVRRGVSAPETLETDVLAHTPASSAAIDSTPRLSALLTVREVRSLLDERKVTGSHIMVTDEEGQYAGIVSTAEVMSAAMVENDPLGKLVSQSEPPLSSATSLREVMQHMTEKGIDAVAVVDRDAAEEKLVTHKSIVAVYCERQSAQSRRTQTLRVRVKKVKDDKDHDI